MTLAGARDLSHLRVSMSLRLKIAGRIAELSPVAVAFAKQAVNRVFESTLVEGIRHERALFMSLFRTHDQREGMAVFVKKRKSAFRLG